jgi:UPF0716 protein FxsA
MQRRLGLIALAILTTIAVEVAVFVGVAHLLGLVWAVVLMMAVMALGAWLLQREGTRGWRRFRAASANGHSPGREATNGLVGLLGALLMVVPGFVTSVLGALLMTPVGRRYAGQRMERITERWISPALAGDLFGPRRVRARRGHPTPHPTPAPMPADPLKRDPSREVLEGEIIDVPRTDPR